MPTSSARVTLSIKASEVLNSGIKAGVVPSTILEDLDLANGTADGKIDLVYAKTETAKAASSLTTYDLTASVTDSYGNVMTFAEVCLIAIRNKRSTALAWLKAGPNAANGFGTIAANKGFFNAAADLAVVGPDSRYVVYDKVGVVVDATHSDFDVACSAVVGDVNTWDILILGRSA